MWLLHEVLKLPYPKALIEAIMKHFELTTKLTGNAVIVLSTHPDVMGLILGWFVCVVLKRGISWSASALEVLQYRYKIHWQNPEKALVECSSIWCCRPGTKWIGQAAEGKLPCCLTKVNWCFCGLILQGTEYFGFLPAFHSSQGQTTSLQGQIVLYCGPFK